ncbi:relaxase MobL [Mesomycoplasma neurolyticum]|uniref:Uncharacterized protein n=1 Tax=Mesomycoplasma neurolyticum TaxID=2120 RepID=A0A449A5U3_9BACT|nr:relaxase MobL [Mesomycoplasma neurolyticum]VEU59592.1 Uncharacterised protein [Mesomycoplasma neurolyticum]
MQSSVFKITRFAKGTNEYYKKGKVIDYITRPSAVYKSTKTSNEILALVNEQTQLEKVLNSLVNEQSSINSGLFKIKSKKANLIAVEKAKNIYKKLKKEQLIWDAVLSFEYERMKNANIVSQQEYADFLASNFEYFLKSEKFNLKNLDILFAIHTNTKHPHFHILFSEKMPTTWNYKQKKFKFRSKGSLEIENIKKFQKYLDMKLLHKKDYETLWNIKKEVFEIKTEIKHEPIFKVMFNEQNNFYDDLQKIKKYYKNNKKPTFNLAPKEIQESVIAIKDYLLKNNELFFKKVNIFQQKLDTLQELEIDKIFDEEKTEFINNQLNEFNNQLNNQILKNAAFLNEKIIAKLKSSKFHEKTLLKKIIKKLTWMPYKIYQIKKSFDKGYDLIND